MALFSQWEYKGGLWGIWKIEESFAELRSRLSSSLPYEDELASLKAEARRMEYVAVRVLLAALCGEEKQVLHHSSGKPYLADGSFQITISHTRGYVSVGLHPVCPVGIDIEYVSHRIEKVVSRFLRPDEQANSTVLQLLHWSAKETLFKLLDCREVDFIHHLQVMPFAESSEGCFSAKEYRTPRQQLYEVRYKVHPEFVCTWSLSVLSEN